MSKILVIGEILIDLIEEDKKFNYSIGGAPFNVAYNLSSLGDDVTFVGQVGKDYFGEFILNSLRNNKNLNCAIEEIEDKNTTVALNVSLNNERKYSFIRKNTADYAYNLENILKIDFSDFDLIHLGSLFLSNLESIKIMQAIVERAKENKIKISFDVNYREDLFNSFDEAKERYKFFIDNADIIKFSDEEISLFYPNLKEEEVIHNFNEKCLIITKGNKGSLAYIDNKIYTYSSFKVKVKDTIGAGDSFFSGFLHSYLKNNFANISDAEAIESLRFASACGALTCSKSGALNGYTCEKDVINFIDKSLKRKIILNFED